MVEGRVISVFPFVQGDVLDREDAQQREAAANLLGRLHSAALVWPDRKPRPNPGPESPANWVTPPDPPELEDPELDRALGVLTRVPASKIAGPIHGDFYRRNVLWRGGRIAGLVDWDDSRIEPLAQEVAWSVWELCKIGDDLDDERAQAFLEAYRGAGGPVRELDLSSAALLIRWNLRNEIRRWMTAEEHGAYWDQSYRDHELRAFGRLRQFAREV